MTGTNPPSPIPPAAGAYPIPPPPRRERRWIPVNVLTQVLLFVVMGGFVVAAGIGLDEASGLGTPSSVSVADVRFTPQPGWVVARRLPAPAQAVQLTRGAGNLLVLVTLEETDPGAALDGYIEDVLQPEATELQVAEEVEEVPLPEGVPGLRRFYVGTFGDVPAPLEGDLTAFVLPGGPAMIFDGWATEGTYRLFAAEVHAMVETAERA
jgi:hypothetical protein